VKRFVATESSLALRLAMMDMQENLDAFLTVKEYFLVLYVWLTQIRDQFARTQVIAIVTTVSQLVEME